MTSYYCSLKQFTQDENGEICTICKKKLIKNQIIIQCPKCDSYFHHEHIMEWYNENQCCPVCKSSIEIASELKSNCLVQEEEKFLESDQNLELKDTQKIKSLVGWKKRGFGSTRTYTPKEATPQAESIMSVIGRVRL